MTEANKPIRQFLSFRLHEDLYALPMESVLEVVRMVAITRIPKAPVWLLGVINLRGVVLPVIDLRRRLGLLDSPSDLNTPIMIVQVKDRMVGLIADSAEEVLSLPCESITAPNELTKKSRPVEAIARNEDLLVLILDLPRIMTGIEKFNLKETQKEWDEAVTSKA